MKAWAVEELQDAELGDQRRKKRLMRIVSDLAAQPNASVPQASGNLAATQAAYEFWKSPYIKPEAIASAHQSRTLERIKPRVYRHCHSGHYRTEFYPSSSQERSRLLGQC